MRAPTHAGREATVSPKTVSYPGPIDESPEEVKNVLTAVVSMLSRELLSCLLDGWNGFGGVESWGVLVPRGYNLHSIVLGKLRPGIN